MSEESPTPLPPAEESIEAETGTAPESEPETGEPEPEATSEPGFVCACEPLLHSACAGLPFYDYHEGRRYCVLHYPSTEKSEDFYPAFSRKISAGDFDFRGVFFPGYVSLSDHHFNHRAVFSFATFSGEADFSRATFEKEAYFSKARFCADVLFREATFKAKADFFSVKFNREANLGSVTFSGVADFSSATFSADTDFDFVTFSADSHFSSAIFSAAANFTSAKFSADASFEGTTFSAVAAFSETTFSAAADFGLANFSADAHFETAEFGTGAFFFMATFSAVAAFNRARFDADANFVGATFGAVANFLQCQYVAAADFTSATFRDDVYFWSATFSAAANFNQSVFHARADFRNVFFNDSVHFFGRAGDREVPDAPRIGARTLGENPSLGFEHVRIDHPERLAFHTLNLRPHWFINVDPRRLVFTDISWDWNHISIEQEIAALQAIAVSPEIEVMPVEQINHLLTIACRQLAENAESNNRYEEASRFRYWAMDLARRTKWKGWRLLKTDWLHMLYWAVSGYGERILRALGVLASVWIVFVLLYTQVGFEQKPQRALNESASTLTVASTTVEDRIGQPLGYIRALTYSLAVMSLQKPEPKPLTGTAQTLVLLETILGPVQAALLALAIRRKFMR